MIDQKVKQERTVLIGIINHEQNEERVKEYLDELEFLIETADGIPVKRFVQNVSTPNPATLIGSGKVHEIIKYIEENEIDIAIFDDELTGSQARNLEKELKCRILDRTNLILDIFARRARTSHAKVQVELAQYQYLLPRLTGMWTHLEKQRGGIGLRGPGEQEIETDRRIIKERIAFLKDKLEIIDKQMTTQRKSRGQLVRIALVGYTNVGKSTIMNMLSKSEIFAENKLFATLDTTVRKVVIQNLPFLLSDTVGFIRKLPHHLVESFKSTLDEVREADIILHIVDISHPNFEEQISVVNQTLSELKANDKPVIIIFNKIDAYTFTQQHEDDLMEPTKENYSLEYLKSTWMAKTNESCIFISATHRTNIDELKKTIYTLAVAIHTRKYPYNNFLYPM